MSHQNGALHACSFLVISALYDIVLGLAGDPLKTRVLRLAPDFGLGAHRMCKYFPRSQPRLSCSPPGFGCYGVCMPHLGPGILPFGVVYSDDEG